MRQLAEIAGRRAHLAGGAETQLLHAHTRHALPAAHQSRVSGGKPGLAKQLFRFVETGSIGGAVRCHCTVTGLSEASGRPSGLSGCEGRDA
jgi:hypothetical protein